MFILFLANMGKPAFKDTFLFINKNVFCLLHAWIFLPVDKFVHSKQIYTA